MVLMCGFNRQIGVQGAVYNGDIIFQVVNVIIEAGLKGKRNCPGSQRGS